VFEKSLLCLVPTLPDFMSVQPLSKDHSFPWWCVTLPCRTSQRE
jgi:hypothetical protein